VRRDSVRGLTTAAGVWLTAAVRVSDLNFARMSEEEGGDPRAVAVRLELRGRHSLTELASDLGDLDGVLAVHVADANADPD
jgi:uncharacterized membrane protein YhiD involved in acid resistance